MIELDRLRYDLVHSTPAEEDAAAKAQPRGAETPPWLATMVGALLTGYGLTRRRRFVRLCFLAAGAGLIFYGWERQRRSAACSPCLESDEEHPVDIASQGSFPASDPPSLSQLA